MSKVKYYPLTGIMLGARGKPVTSKDSDGYLQVWFESKTKRVHLVAWYLSYGQWPTSKVDHIDGDRTNNKISNLRLATDSQNSWNSKLRSDNTSGHKGVYPLNNKWSCRIKVNNKSIYLGSYVDYELACLVVDEARSKYHGDFSKC